MLHQSLVSPWGICIPGSQSSPQLHIDVHMQPRGVVVAGSATEPVNSAQLFLKPDSSSYLPWAKGQDDATKWR